MVVNRRDADSLETLAAGLERIEESTLIVQDALRRQRPVAAQSTFAQQLRAAVQQPGALWKLGAAALVGAGIVAAVSAAFGPAPARLEPALAVAEIPIAPAVKPAAAPVEPVVIVEDEPPAPEAAPGARTRARDAARALTKRAKQARAAGKQTQATKLYRQALAALPTYGPAAQELALMHLDRGDYRTALRYAKQALRGAPRKLPYMILVGDLHHLLGQDKTARRHWELAAHYGSARAQRRLDKLDPDA